MVSTGFGDQNCNLIHYYICKKPIGNFYAATYFDIVFSLYLFRVLKLTKKTIITQVDSVGRRG